MSKTEYEKMLSGEIYHSGDSEMLRMCKKARELTHQYNSNPTASNDFKEKTLINLLGHIGSNVVIDTPFYTDYGVHVSIGNNVIIGMNCIFIDNHKITIGSNVMIASGVQICTATHPIKAEERILENWNSEMNRNWFHTLAKEVIIEDNVWIGANVTILPGVIIGKNTTIGAGSVVNKSIPESSLAAGVPCKVIKQI